MNNKWSEVDTEWSKTTLYWNEAINRIAVNSTNTMVSTPQIVEAMSNLSIPESKTNLVSKEATTNMYSKETKDNPTI